MLSLLKQLTLLRTGKTDFGLIYIYVLFRIHQDVLYDYRADLYGISNRTIVM